MAEPRPLAAMEAAPAQALPNTNPIPNEQRAGHPSFRRYEHFIRGMIRRTDRLIDNVHRELVRYDELR